MRRFWVVALLLFQMSQPAFGLESNIYDISPDSWSGFWKKSRKEQERLLVDELDARLSREIRSAARGRLARNGAIAMATVATVAIAYHMDVHGSVITTWLEWRGDVIALANRHIRSDINNVYNFIQAVNNGQETGQTIDEPHLLAFFEGGVKPTRVLTSELEQRCIEFTRVGGEDTDAKTLVIPEFYWPGIAKILQEKNPEFPTHYEFPKPETPVGNTIQATGGITSGVAQLASSAPMMLDPYKTTISSLATVVLYVVTRPMNVVGEAVEASGQAWTSNWASETVEITAIADALRRRNLTASLAKAAGEALAKVAAAGTLLWNWKEVLGVGGIVTMALTGIYDRVIIPFVPHLYAAGDYAARFPGMMRDDFLLAFYHVTFSELIDDERAYIKLRHFMYPPLVERVDQILIDAHDGKVSADQASQFVRYAMRMPLTERYEQYDQDDLQDRFNVFFNYYDQNTKEVFKGLLEDTLTENLLVAESLRIGVARSSTLNRHTFLHGPHGVGKTYGVSGFAEITNRPLSKMQLHASDQVQNEGLAFGLDGASPGRIAMGLMREPSDTSYHTLWSVALYDEADTSLNNAELVEFWKGALDPNSDGVYLPYFGVTFPWPHNVFFLGNTPIQDPALLSRLDVAQLAPYSQDQKRAILTDRLVPRLLKNDFNTIDFQAGTTRAGSSSEDGILSRIPPRELRPSDGPDKEDNEDSYLFRNLPAALQRELVDLLDIHQADPGMRGIEAGAKRVLGRHLLYHINSDRWPQ